MHGHEKNSKQEMYVHDYVYQNLSFIVHNIMHITN